MRIVRHTAIVAAPAAQIFSTLEDPRAADRVNPEFLRTHVEASPWLPRVGERTRLALTFRGARYALETEIVEYRRGFFLLQRQTTGPFATFEHALSLEEQADGSQVTEVLAYTVRLGILGRAFDRLALRADLQHVLVHRARRLAELWTA